MKKVVTVLVMVLAFNLSNAQEAFSEYSRSKITLTTEKGKSQGKLFLDLQEDGKVGLVLTEKTRTSYLEFMSSSYDKIKEWSDLALANNVQDARKDIASKSFRAFFMYGDWNFGTATLQTRFIVKEGKPFGYVYIPEIQSSTNQYITSRDSIIYYITEDLIKELEDNLNEEVINNFITSKTQSNTLFE